MAALLVAGLVWTGWSWRAVAAASHDALPGGVRRIQDDGERFVAFYGHLPKPLSVLDTWRALRGLRKQLEEAGQPRRIAGIIYRSRGKLYMAAVDFNRSEVFIDRVGSQQALTLIWRKVEADFRPGWSLRPPDLIQSSDPGKVL